MSAIPSASGRRGQRALLPATEAAFAAAMRVQDVNTRARRVHCQSGPSMPLGTGSGWVIPIATAAVMATSVTTAAQAAIRPGIRKLEVMVCAPHQRAQANIGHPRPGLCDRDHKRPAFSAAGAERRGNTPAQPAGNPWTTHAIPLRPGAASETLVAGKGVRGRTMSKHDAGYDYTRYQKLLAEAVDERKRLELIDLMIREKARDRLADQRMSDRVAMTTATVSKVLGPSVGRRSGV